MQLPATATLAEASALVKATEQAVAGLGAGSGALRIEAGALNSFDTSLLAVLMHARRLAQAAGRGFELAGAPVKLAQLATLYGVEELLGLATVKPSLEPSLAREVDSVPGAAPSSTAAGASRA